MSGFGSAILGLTGTQDPRMQLLQQVMGGTSGAPQPAGGTSAGAGGAAATTTPAQPPAQPEVYQSPPQLMELYSNMMKYQNRAGMIDNGIGLIASAFAQPENRAGVRQALMSGSSAGGGVGNDPMKFIGEIMSLQQQQKAIRDRAERRAGVAGLAETHGLDVKTAEFLFDNDQLDEVLSALSKPENQIVDLEDGTKVIVDKNTGKIGTPFGPSKKREMEVVEDDRGNKFAVWKDTKERVGGDNIVDGLGASTMEREWRVANEERAAAGQPAIAFEDFIHQRGRSGAGSSNFGPSGIDYGKPPTDMAWAREKDGSIKVDENGAPVAVPISGSKLWTEQQEASKKKSDRQGQKAMVSGFIDQSIEDSLGYLKPHKDSWLPGVTGFGAIAEYLPATEARKLSGSLDTLRANLGFEKLQQMREASPTGGALGQVSDFENKLLQATFGKLDQYGDDDVLVRNLFRIQYMADAIVNGIPTEDGPVKFDENDIDSVKRMRKELFDKADEAAEAWMAEGRDEDEELSPEDAELEELLKKYPSNAPK